MTPIYRLFAVLATLALPIAPATAGTEGDGRAVADFGTCIAHIGERAAASGIPRTIIDEHLAEVRWIDRVVELDRRQPEFTTPFADYFGRRVTDQRVQQGREILDAHRPLLDELTAEYGIPPQYLVAFWGLETNYGGYTGDMPVLDALATLACDGRRGEYFTSELIHALHILDDEAIAPERMRGSWAGAMGHVQFMPSIFRAYAIDHDGSGRRDLWDSTTDALASAANFLHHIGWQSGFRWGREVSLPDDFPYGETGRDRSRPLAEWQQLGVRTADGAQLPAATIDAAVLVPAGHRGPAFLVYDNFDVIMDWNRSEFYALTVGILADRIAGSPGLRQPPPEGAVALERERVAAVQRQLNERGFAAGPPDGIVGPMTRQAIRGFQQKQGMIADGYLSDEVLTRLDGDHSGIR